MFCPIRTEYSDVKEGSSGPGGDPINNALKYYSKTVKGKSQ